MDTEDRFRLAEEGKEGAFVLIDKTHPSSMFVGVRRGRRAFLLVSDQRPSEPPKFSLITSEVAQREDGRWALSLVLEQIELAALFTHLVNDLVRVTRKPTTIAPAELVIRRLRHWQELLSKAPSGVLGPRALVGLAAELRFLQDEAMPRKGALAAVLAWNGPQRAPRDFQFSDVEVEIKALQVGATEVLISSLEQLSPASVSIRIASRVVEIRSDPTEADVAMSGLVSGVRASCGDHEDARLELEDRLILAGYLDLPAYDSIFVSFGKLAIFDVTEAFPRLTRDGTPDAVANCRYSLRIASILPFLMPTW